MKKAISEIKWVASVRAYDRPENDIVNIGIQQFESKYCDAAFFDLVADSGDISKELKSFRRTALKILGGTHSALMPMHNCLNKFMEVLDDISQGGFTEATEAIDAIARLWGQWETFEFIEAE